jgi:hypothetical protein
MKKFKIFCIIILLNIIISYDILANDINGNRKIFNQDKDTIYYTTGEYKVNKIKNIRHAYLIFISNSTMDNYYTLISPKKNVRLDEKIKEGETYIMQIIYLAPKQKYVQYIGDKFPRYFIILDKVIRISKRDQFGTIVMSPNVLDKYYRENYFIAPEVFKELNNDE